MKEKLAASEVFKEVWKNCTSDAKYLQLKEQWQKEKKDYAKSSNGKKTGVRKEEVGGDAEVKTKVKEEDLSRD